MERELLEQLKGITGEEQEILSGKNEIEKSIYTKQQEFVVNARQMLNKGKLIDIRTHTRFVHFPRHSHDYIEIIYMCSGQTTHRINGKEEVTLEKGDLLFLNRNATHEIYPAQEDDIAVNFIYFKVADILPIQNLIENMIWSLVYRQGNARNINQTTMGLLILQLANYTDRIAGMNQRHYEQSLMLTVLRYIEEHYKEGTLTELAELVNQSVTGLSRFIKKQSGMNFQQLVQQKRLNQAVFLLTTTKLTVEEIILAVGYDNSSYFHRIFRERYGVTPKKYRMDR